MSLRNINKENNHKLALKREGHSLVDRIKWKGYSKDSVYLMLAKELGVEERLTHFASVHSVRELEARVDALRRINDRVPKTVMASKSYTYQQQAVTTKVLRVKDIKQLPSIGKVKKKKAKVSVPKVDYGRNTLPREQMIEAIEQMRLDRIARESGQEIPSSVVIDPATVPQKRGIMELVKSLFIWRH